jgi:hypothetical protein
MTRHVQSIVLGCVLLMQHRLETYQALLDNFAVLSHPTSTLQAHAIIVLPVKYVIDDIMA